MQGAKRPDGRPEKQTLAASEASSSTGEHRGEAVFSEPNEAEQSVLAQATQSSEALWRWGLRPAGYFEFLTTTELCA